MPRTLIRPETARDVSDIRDINIEAFRDHPVSRQTEHLIVDALRAAGELEVSLVATQGARPVGHIAFSKADVGDSDEAWYLLGPVAVLPDFQGKGIGSALVVSGLAEVRAKGASGCVLVGDPGFYGRFGFSTFPGLMYEGVPEEYVLAVLFGESTPSGRIRASDAFEIEPGPDAAQL